MVIRDINDKKYKTLSNNEEGNETKQEGDRLETNWNATMNVSGLTWHNEERTGRGMKNWRER